MSLVKVMSHYKQSHCFHHRTDIKTQVVERERVWVPRNVQYMTDKIISDTDSIIRTPGIDGT